MQHTIGTKIANTSDCLELCRQVVMPNCNAYTWFDKTRGKSALQCIGRNDSQYTPAPQEGAVSGYGPAKVNVWEAKVHKALLSQVAPLLAFALARHERVLSERGTPTTRTLKLVLAVPLGRQAGWRRQR
jgi:hypothetical protein